MPERSQTHHSRGEFDRLTELSHPNIVRVLDAGVLAAGGFAGRAFLVMDFVAGQTLAESLACEMPSERFKRFALAAESLADALAYLHGQGVVHGDISPANIRCDDSGRPILIDFGLAQHLEPFASSAVSGTLGFIAPEALLGERGPAGDLFALGATLYDAWAGIPPFGVGIEAVKQTWQGQPTTPSSLHPGLPPAWDRLLIGLLAPAAEDRPASARELLQAIRRELPGHSVSVESDLGIPFPAGDPLAGVVVGRSEELATLHRHLEQLAEGMGAASVLCIVGAPGSGRRTLIQRVLRQARLAILSQTLAAFDIEESECSKLLGGSEEPPMEPLQEAASKAQAQLARIAGELEERAKERPLCLALAGSPEDAALARAIAGSAPSGRLLVFLPCEREIERPGSVCVKLTPLSRTSIAELARRGAGSEPPRAILDEITAASGGLAGASALLVRNWIARLRGGAPQAGTLAQSDRDMACLLDASFASLSGTTRVWLLRIALSEGKGEATEYEHYEHDSEAAEAEARAAGWVLVGGVSLPSELHLSAVWRALAKDLDLQRTAGTLLGSLPDDDVRRAEVQLAIGERSAAAVGFWLAMRTALTKMAWSKVAEYGLRALATDRVGGTHEERLALASALGILGRYDEALTLLGGCEPPSAPADVAILAERKAWLLGRRGDPEAARRILETALLGMAPDGEGAMLLRARLARVLVTSGHFDEALAVAAPALGARSLAGMAAREAAVLALAYSGKLEAARQILDALTVDARETKDPSLTARITTLDGLVEQLVGRPAQAAKAYEQAVRQYEQVRDLHGAAAAAFNLGCTLAETGNYSGSMEALERAIRELGRLGAVTDHALAVFNVGQLFLQLGDLEAAARAVKSLEEDAHTSHVEAFAGHARLLTAQVQRKRGTLQDAVRSYHEAGETFARVGMQAMVEMANIERAESLAQQLKISEARAILSQVEAGRSGADHGASALPRAEALACARARIDLSDPSATPAESVALAESLVERASQARELGRLPMAWRLASLASRLFNRSRDAREAQTLHIARTCFREVKMKTPAKYWPGLESDNDANVIEWRAGDSKSTAGLVERAALLEGRLRRLLRINKRLNSDLRLSRVLETIIDTVIELTDAERGFLLLKDSDGELVVKVARNIDQTSLEGPGTSLSRSIAKQAADSGEPVITVDAAGDSRFSELLSVSDLHLRSVLAVPLAVKGQVVGTIYVDHRLRKGVFGDDELAMVLDFADQGAIAIENARVVAELRRREQQVQSLNRRLERELKLQEAALS
ncbi:MAG TPA: GAF domain-containing protein, partial [Polyangia bacterium]